MTISPTPDRTLVAIDPFNAVFPSGSGTALQRFRARRSTRLDQWRRGQLNVDGMDRGVMWSQETVEQINRLATVAGTDVVYMPRRHLDFQAACAMTGLECFDIVQGRTVDDRYERLGEMASAYDRLVLFSSTELWRHIRFANIVPDVLTVTPNSATGPDRAILRRVLMFCQSSAPRRNRADAPHTLAA